MECDLNNMHYLDTGVFLEYFSSDLGNRHKGVVTLMKAAESEQIKVYTSAITLAEVVYLRHPKTEDHKDYEKFDLFLENFFKLPYINIIEFDREIAKITRQLVRKYSYSPSADMIHLASAIRLKANYFNTTDMKLINKFPEKSFSLPNSNKVIIQEPQLEGQTSLF